MDTRAFTDLRAVAEDLVAGHAAAVRARVPAEHDRRLRDRVRVQSSAAPSATNHRRRRGVCRGRRRWRVSGAAAGSCCRGRRRVAAVVVTSSVDLAPTLPACRRPRPRSGTSCRRNDRGRSRVREATVDTRAFTDLRAVAEDLVAGHAGRCRCSSPSASDDRRLRDRVRVQVRRRRRRRRHRAAAAGSNRAQSPRRATRRQSGSAPCRPRPHRTCTSCRTRVRAEAPRSPSRYRPSSLPVEPVLGDARRVRRGGPGERDGGRGRLADREAGR